LTGRLDGRRVLVTRAADDADGWAATLAGEGAEPIVLPCIASEPIDDPGLGPRLEAALTGADWLVFTSRRGVETFCALVDPPLPAMPAIAVVGEATAKLARERLGRVDLVGAGTAAALAEALAQRVAVTRGARCLLVLAANANDRLAATLAAAGAAVERFDVYRTLPAAADAPRRKLSALGCDAVLFASPTAVTGFANLVDVDIDAQMVTIGPSTSAAVRARHWPVSGEAREPSLSAMIESMMESTHV
jgi:uroporphyrinogen-III synthase